MKRLGLMASLLLATTVQGQELTAAEQFFNHLSGLCGKAYSGELIKGGSSGDGFTGQPLVMHVRQCSKTEIRIPLHVGEDRSRTWVISKTADGLRLKHDHRHQDGSEDAVTHYGGDSRSPGTESWQSFPVDEFSIANFKQHGLAQSVTNVWHLGLDQQNFSYRLTREKRDFLLQFNLSNEVTPPPAPWGH
ncbi:hypothetical protein [Shewanella algae]|uniref:hypothetical protein n=1 Tax=Shewanella algae TaxID=38313 RepID=UPI001AAD9E79|nr:hypothetical protein [Shewanella algae]MBO2576299.1 hypothetical protein [Shewanella algae]MBO2681864.1 hypothetical protein [Shewanella algae]BCV62927.1 hypothetical protein TUM17386_25980 [Shewanella algae]